MVGKHLVVIFAGGFDVDDKDLLEPEGQLSQVVPFQSACHVSGGPTSPDCGIVEPVRGIMPQMLWGKRNKVSDYPVLTGDAWA